MALLIAIRMDRIALIYKILFRKGGKLAVLLSKEVFLKMRGE